MTEQAGERRHLFDDPRRVRAALRGFFVLCALLAGLELVVHRHVVHPWEGVWGFYAVYGFVACVLLVLVARQMRKVLMRDEHYYDRDD